MCMTNISTTLTNYFTIFLQMVNMINSYWLSSKPFTNITFLLITNHQSYEQIVKASTSENGKPKSKDNLAF